MPIVNGLAEEYKGKLAFSIIEQGDESWAARIAKYGFKLHGMVITDQNDDVVWKEEGHNMKKDGIKAAIDKALAG